MLTNYIVDADLKKYFPKLTSYLWTEQADYTTQINEAFANILDELRSRNIEPRKLHIPLDINRDYDSETKQDRLTRLTKTETGSSSKYAIGMTGFRRFVVEALTVAGTTPTLAATLQGSNDILESDAAPANWTDIISLNFTMIASKNILFAAEYKYYRLKWVIGGTAGPSFTFTAAIVETYVDRWIVWKAFELIFRSFSKDPDDIWMKRSIDAQSIYIQAMEAAKFLLDMDDDNVPEAGEENSAETTFYR